MKYHYKDYGLHIFSDIELHELHALDEDVPADVEIILGHVAEHLEHPLEVYDQYEAKIDELLVCIDDVARFRISNGNLVVVDPFPDASPEELKIYLIESCLAALIYQRGRLPFHGSALVIHGKGVILAGHSGAGKSTLAKALDNMGFPCMTDDVVCIDIGKDHAMIEPGYARQKLWIDSANYLRVNMDNTVRIDSEREKVYIPMTHFNNEPAVLSAIFVIEPHEVEDVRLHRLSGKAKLVAIIENTYLSGLVAGMGISGKHFEQTGKLMQWVDVYRLVRPVNRFSLEEQIGVVLDAVLLNGGM